MVSRPFTWPQQIKHHPSLQLYDAVCKFQMPWHNCICLISPMLRTYFIFLLAFCYVIVLLLVPTRLGQLEFF